MKDSDYVMADGDFLYKKEEGGISKDDIPTVRWKGGEGMDYECNKTFDEFKAYIEELKDSKDQACYYYESKVDGVTTLSWKDDACLINSENIHDMYLNVPENVTEGISLLDSIWGAMGNDGNFYEFSA